MELISLKSPTLTTVPSSLSRSSLLGKPLTNGQVKFQNSRNYQDARKLKFLCFRPHALGTIKAGSEAVATIQNEIKKDEVVFVAGATGKVGSRTVRELLKLGFQVRAGVRTAQKAEALVRSVKEMKIDTNTSSEDTQAVEKLEIVECDLEQPDRIRAALGKASVVICCIGASEKEVFDVTGPYRIDYQATKNLIDAAAAAKVKHFMMVSSLGTNKIGFPAAILNLFWGVLIWKRKAEEALVASGLPYTIVRPGGMERPTDAYKETHNITLSKEDTLFGGQVSNLQVAELLAFMAKNRSLSYCKLVEVVAETTAPLTPLGDLLSKIPSKGVAPKEPEAEGQPDPETTKNVLLGDLTESVEKEPAPSPTSSPSIIVNAAKVGDPEPSTGVTAEAPSLSVKELPPPSKATPARPLSPYAAYDGLKPPTSPTPAPPSCRKDASVDAVKGSNTAASSTVSSEAVATSVQKEPPPSGAIRARPLSPYAAYDSLKPPTSPTPAQPNRHKDANVDAVKVSDSAASTAVIIEALATSGQKEPPPTEAILARPLSPYVAYEDLKPPTSPSPVPSIASRLSESSVDGRLKINAMSSNSDTEPTTLDKPIEKKQHKEPTLKPLSPYAMYDELKPPTTPMPTPRKLPS